MSAGQIYAIHRNLILRSYREENTHRIPIIRHSGKHRSGQRLRHGYACCSCACNYAGTTTLKLNNRSATATTSNEHDYQHHEEYCP